MKIVIVGGVAGGMSAATRLRRLKEGWEIIIIEKGPYVSFANCGLPYYVSGEIADRKELFVQTPAKLKQRFNLDVRTCSEVIDVSPTDHQVIIKNEEKTYTETYDKLILSPGATPIVPPIKGLKAADNVYTLRNVPDLDRIMAQVNEKPKRAAVIGAGFIGLEMAESLRKRGIEVALIERAPHVLPPFDEEMAAFAAAELRRNGINLYIARSAVEFADGGKKIILDDGTVIKTDLTLLSVGIRPASGLAKKAGLATGLREGILVNEKYQTSDPDIYAVGDAIVVNQQVTGQGALISLASPANRQGREAADVLAGLTRRNLGSIGTSIVRIFELTAASTGLNERQAREAGLDIAVIHILGKAHAAYFPGASDMLLKLIFHPKSGEIYGAQGIGHDGVDKRIDVLSTIVKSKLTVFDLPEMEFSYAPPFGAAKDPVNMLGYAAMNIVEGISHSIQWYQLKDELKKGKVLLDVRNRTELAEGSFPNSINIPLDELRARLNELDPNLGYIVSCHSGQRSYIAERIMRQHGFKVWNLDGAAALYKVVRPEDMHFS